MFVYTFENITNLKNLKHSDSIKPKHQKKIDMVKDGLFANFDYSEFKEKQPPKNESLQTYNELRMLQHLPKGKDYKEEKRRAKTDFENAVDKVDKDYALSLSLISKT